MSENEKNTIKIFENQNIKDVWDSEKEDYYFSIIDIIKALTGDETINETFDPSKAINRGITQYKSQEYNDTWIENGKQDYLHYGINKYICFLPWHRPHYVLSYYVRLYAASSGEMP